MNCIHFLEVTLVNQKRNFVSVHFPWWTCTYCTNKEKYNIYILIQFSLNRNQFHFRHSPKERYEVPVQRSFFTALTRSWKSRSTGRALLKTLFIVCFMNHDLRTQVEPGGGWPLRGATIIRTIECHPDVGMTQSESNHELALNQMLFAWVMNRFELKSGEAF